MRDQKFCTGPSRFRRQDVGYGSQEPMRLDMELLIMAQNQSWLTVYRGPHLSDRFQKECTFCTAAIHGHA